MTVTGRDAEYVTIHESDGRLTRDGPDRRTGFFQGSSTLEMIITVPAHTEMMVKTGSADVIVDGTSGPAQVKSGSGEVTVAEIAGPGQLETGSGDVSVETARGELRIKSGSGDVEVRRAESAVAVEHRLRRRPPRHQPRPGGRQDRLR